MSALSFSSAALTVTKRFVATVGASSFVLALAAASGCNQATAERPAGEEIGSVAQRAYVCTDCVCPNCYRPSLDLDCVTDPSNRVETCHGKATSRSGAPIAVTSFRRVDDYGLSLPAILHGHGFGQPRTTVFNASARPVYDYVNSGYGVVTFDFPGHGQSTEFAYVMQPTPELAAVEGVIDWMYDALPWVMREDTRTGIPKDIRVGGSGASYGGAWQILAAQKGGNRLDAIVPMQAWADLNQGLVPNGALNEHWLNLLFAAGTVSATRRDPSFTAWFAESKVINTWPADGRSRFRTASPAFYGSPIRVPTLYIQSAPDTLFNMNHAILNSKMNVGDVKLYTINVEHVGPGATQTTGSTVPCGASTLDDQSRWIDQAIRWYDKYLRGAMADVGSPVDIGLDNGTCIHPDIRALKFPDVVGVNQTFSLSTGPIKISDQPAVFTIPFVSQPQVVGIPRVRFTVESWGLAAPGAPVAEIAPPGCLVPCLPALLEVDNETLVFSLVAASGKGGVTVLDGQSTPIRRQNVVADIVSFDPCPSQPWLAPCALPGLVVEVTPTGYVVSADLAGVASDIAGRVLSLVVQRVHPKYSAERIPGEVVIKDLSVTLPFMDLPPDAIPSRTLETSQPFVADSL